MPDPPKLDYGTPPSTPKPNTSQRVIGLFGFLVYALPAFAFDSATIQLIRANEVGLPSASILICLGLLGGFCTWRAIVALIQLLK